MLQPGCCSSTSEVTESGVALPQDDLHRDELIGLIGDVLGIALALRQRHGLAGASEQWLLPTTTSRMRPAA